MASMLRAAVIATARPIVFLGAFLGALSVMGCSDSNLNTDFGAVEPGCRPTDACYKIGADCPCTRIAATGSSNADMNPSTCVTCDPTTTTCFCVPGTLCTEGADICVGRAAALCPGSGARCLPAGASCASSGGNPPQLVGTGAGGSLEPRCQYTDDVCCPGVLDMSVI